MKKFIITIDTEGDDQWSWRPGVPIRTENTRFLPRFQSLCEEYGFKPVWLTNYEMIQDPDYVDFIASVEERKAGELGTHLHAWSTPPEYELDMSGGGAPYLIEYPENIMEEKLAYLTEELTKKTGVKPVTHRAGRWAMNDHYFELLKKYGYEADCSVTPREDWSSHVGGSKGSKGSNYKEAPCEPYFVDAEKKLLEVPMTIRKSHKLYIRPNAGLKSIMGSVIRSLKGSNIWYRPGHSPEKLLNTLSEQILRSDSDYLMFMLHSSELMPGGSPNFKTSESIEELYLMLERLFKEISRHFEGCTLRQYSRNYTRLYKTL